MIYTRTCNIRGSFLDLSPHTITVTLSLYGKYLWQPQLQEPHRRLFLSEGRITKWVPAANPYRKFDLELVEVLSIAVHFRLRNNNTARRSFALRGRCEFG